MPPTAPLKDATFNRRLLLTAGALGAGLIGTAGPARLAAAADAADFAVSTLELWPGAPSGLLNKALAESSPATGTPPMRRTSGVTRPRLDIYRPKTPNGAAMLIIPGGGYRIVSIDNEGHMIARFLAEAGITAFILTYRLPAEGWAKASDVPLMDAQRAMRLIRAHAADYAIDPARVGVMGFSAGGHLCTSLATRSEAKVYEAIDAADALSARAALFAAIYPVVSMRPGVTHQGSHDNLIGTTPDEATTALYSTDEQVTAQTPPAFILHAEDDKTVPVENALRLRAALKAAGVTVETHLYPKGGHGFGLRSPDVPWGPLFLRFARAQGLFT
ncbi:MAG: alpha/beta hydrolase [Asticcacaulis sp.]